MSRLRGFLRRMKALARREPGPLSTAKPTRLDEWRELIRCMLAADGYTVQGSSEKIAVGSRVSVWGTDQPFQNLGPASYEDALRQHRAYQEICNEQMDPPPRPSAEWRYYRFG
jgi:hypothetical protein